jgi:3',5'-nucleoside bisphosphate phosphatase
MAKFEYDIHMHTTISDGKLSWQELLIYAKNEGLKGISITDHNTIGPIEEIAIEASRLGLKYIPATEIKTTCEKQIKEYNNGDFLPTQEFLVYGMSKNSEFLEMSQKHLEGKKDYVKELCRLLKNHNGSEIGLENSNKIMIDTGKIIENAGNYVGASHVIDEIIRKYGEGLTKQDVKPLIVKLQPQALKGIEDDPFYSLDIVEGLKKAKEWGEIVVLAHPLTESRKNMRSFYSEHLIPLLVAHGLDGLELSYPEHTEEDMIFIERLASRYHLLLTGGSDFHKKEDKLYSLGRCGIDEVTFLDLERRIK